MKGGVGFCQRDADVAVATADVDHSRPCAQPGPIVAAYHLRRGPPPRLTDSCHAKVEAIEACRALGQEREEGVCGHEGKVKGRIRREFGVRVRFQR